MAIKTVRIFGDPVLRKPAQRVEDFDETLVNLVDDMIDTMRLEEGIGLAANQIGVSKNVMVIDLSQIDEDYSPVSLVNSEIIERWGSVTAEEGCLSLPGIRENVERAQKIRVRYQNIFGEAQENEFEDLLARVIQHENDHLNGILLVDRISPLKKQLLSARLQKLSSRHDKANVRV